MIPDFGVANTNSCSRRNLPRPSENTQSTSFPQPPSLTLANSVSVHSVIYSLLVFLSALPEPVVPCAFQEQCLAAARQASSSFTAGAITTGTAIGTTSTSFTGPGSATGVVACYQAISCLPLDHQNLFFYLVSFIKRCLSYREKNRTSEDMLGELNESPGSPASPKDPRFLLLASFIASFHPFKREICCRFASFTSLIN